MTDSQFNTLLGRIDRLEGKFEKGFKEVEDRFSTVVLSIAGHTKPIRDDVEMLKRNVATLNDKMDTVINRLDQLNGKY